MAQSDRPDMQLGSPDQEASSEVVLREVPPTPASWRRLRLPAWQWATAGRLVGFYIIVRLALLVADVLSAHETDGGQLIGPLEAWDGGHYLQIAESGYPPPGSTSTGSYGPAGFSPLFPMLVRSVHWFGLTYVAAALVVSIIGGAVATAFVWRLGARLFDELTGQSAAMLFMVFPGMAIPWGSFYSECVGLAFTAAALLMLVEKRWLLAGVLGAFASASNPLGIGVSFAALIALAQAVLHRERPKAVLAVLLSPTGFIAFAAWIGARNHDVLYWWHYQSKQWGATIDFGTSLVRMLPHFWGGSYQGRTWMVWIGLLAIVLAGIAMWRVRMPPVITGYCIVIVALLVLSTQGPKPRLLTWAFPALISVAGALRQHARQYLITAFALLMPIVFVFFTTLGNVSSQP